MFKDENYDACAGVVTARKTALINLAAVAVRLTEQQLNDGMREIMQNIRNSATARNMGDYRGEYTHKSHATTESKSIEYYAKEFADAIQAYHYLTMIDSKGENRELKLID